MLFWLTDLAALAAQVKRQHGSMQCSCFGFCMLVIYSEFYAKKLSSVPREHRQEHQKRQLLQRISRYSFPSHRDCPTKWGTMTVTDTPITGSDCRINNGSIAPNRSWSHVLAVVCCGLCSVCSIMPAVPLVRKAATEMRFKLPIQLWLDKHHPQGIEAPAGCCVLAIAFSHGG